MPMNYVFDASQVNPEQGMGKHPTGKFPASISNTSIEENNNKNGGYFQVTFTTPEGQINKNYNLWFQNPDDGQKKAMEIAGKQLSALCHAIGIFKIDMNSDGKNIHNSRLMIEVTPQTKNPQYNEISKVYDANGNEPGKASAQPQPQPQPQGGWPSQTPAAQPPVQPPQSGWATTPPAIPNAPPPAAAPANTGVGWAQGPSAAPGQAPPWAGGGR